jgi:SpoIID/LytB domain protein
MGLKKRLLNLFFIPLILLSASLGRTATLQEKIGQWFAEGKTDEIQEALTQELELNPSEIDLWLELADLRKSEGDYTGAVAAYQAYLSKKDDWKTRVSLGIALEQMGNFTDAEGSLTQLFHAHPDDPDILWGLGRLRLIQSQWKTVRTQATPQDALKDAQKFFISLTDRRSDFALGFWQLGEVSRRLGDTDRALASYVKAVKLDASYKKAYRYIAKLLAQKKEYRQSLAKYEQAIAIEPDDPNIRKEAGQVAQKAPEEAQKRKDERLRQWAKWVPPAETSIAPSSVTIRVGIFTGLAHLLFRGTSAMEVMTAAQTPLTILQGGQDYQVISIPAKVSPKHKEIWALKDGRNRKILTFDQRIRVRPLDPLKPLLVHAVPSNTGYFFAKEEDRCYRGELEFSPRSGAGFNAINLVSLEAYTAGVLPSEMLSSWPAEALKAQAIVARTYVLSKLGRHNAEGFDVCDSVHCEVYRGLRAETDRTNQAVNETAGIILKHGSMVMPVAFSAQCGGHTQDYQEAWGYAAPVVGVKDYDERYNTDMDFPLSPYKMEKWVKEDRESYCRVFELRGYQNFRWARMILAEDIEKKAGNIGKIRRMRVIHRSTAGWADRLIVEGERGNKELKGDLIRSFLGGIRSNLIWIEPQYDLKGWPEEFIVYGGGWGHGVGMCQVGAYGLAKAGKTADEIVLHYFPKAELKKL